jgi:hypothetical protein
MSREIFASRSQQFALPVKKTKTGHSKQSASNTLRRGYVSDEMERRLAPSRIRRIRRFGKGRRMSTQLCLEDSNTVFWTISSDPSRAEDPAVKRGDLRLSAVICGGRNRREQSG